MTSIGATHLLGITLVRDLSNGMFNFAYVGMTVNTAQVLVDRTLKQCRINIWRFHFLEMLHVARPTVAPHYFQSP